MWIREHSLAIKDWVNLISKLCFDCYKLVILIKLSVSLVLKQVQQAQSKRVDRRHLECQVLWKSSIHVGQYYDYYFLGYLQHYGIMYSRKDSRVFLDSVLPMEAQALSGEWLLVQFLPNASDLGKLLKFLAPQFPYLYKKNGNKYQFSNIVMRSKWGKVC